ncbi:hypothetical protein PABG_12673 [Paracoccidioides brasiliensis Pb03]|nr:hypothetical protein PABG_12673 [Paracoccidioides brasiliensis Pb03]
MRGRTVRNPQKRRCQSPLKGQKPGISKRANIETQLTPILNIRRLEMMNGPLSSALMLTKKPQGDCGPSHTSNENQYNIPDYDE